MDILRDTELIPKQSIKDHNWNTATNFEHDKISQLTMYIALEATCSRKVVTRMEMYSKNIQQLGPRYLYYLCRFLKEGKQNLIMKA